MKLDERVADMEIANLFDQNMTMFPRHWRAGTVSAAEKGPATPISVGNVGGGGGGVRGGGGGGAAASAPVKCNNILCMPTGPFPSLNQEPVQTPATRHASINAGLLSDSSDAAPTANVLDALTRRPHAGSLTTTGQTPALIPQLHRLSTRNDPLTSASPPLF
jgi:hypothetical protein